MQCQSSNSQFPTLVSSIGSRPLGISWIAPAKTKQSSGTNRPSHRASTCTSSHCQWRNPSTLYPASASFPRQPRRQVQANNPDRSAVRLSDTHDGYTSHAGGLFPDESWDRESASDRLGRAVTTEKEQDGKVPLEPESGKIGDRGLVPCFGPGHFETVHRAWTQWRLIGWPYCSKTGIMFTGVLGSRERQRPWGSKPAYYVDGR